MLVGNTVCCSLGPGNAGVRIQKRKRGEERGGGRWNCIQGLNVAKGRYSVRKEEDVVGTRVEDEKGWREMRKEA